MFIIPKTENDGNVGSFMMADPNGNKNDLHIFLSVTFEEDNHEIIVFDKILTENDFDPKVMEQWFMEDEEIEISLNGRNRIEDVPDLNNFIDYQNVLDDENKNEKK